MRLVDWHDRWRLALTTAKNCGLGGSPLAKLRHFLLIARTRDMTAEIISARCNRGAQIARGLGFSAQTSAAIASVDEHWCGMGQPARLNGVEIPVHARIVLLAQTYEVYCTERGSAAAVSMIRARRGTWFDPQLVDLLLQLQRHDGWWLSDLDIASVEELALSLEPSGASVAATDEAIDAVAHAFASVIDAKSSFTWRHSSNVAAYSASIALAMGQSAEGARSVMRAGLLHDIGKLGISNRILDKPGPLNDDERSVMRQHPVWTREILDRVPAFAGIACWAACHHERLDGRGYPWGLHADALDSVSRILAVADVYEAITADRPYRTGMPSDAALQLMRRDNGAAFDSDILSAVGDLSSDGTLARVADSEEEPFAVSL